MKLADGTELFFNHCDEVEIRPAGEDDYPWRGARADGPVAFERSHELLGSPPSVSREPSMTRWDTVTGLLQHVS